MTSKKILAAFLISIGALLPVISVHAQNPSGQGQGTSGQIVDYGKCLAMNELIKQLETKAKEKAKKAIDDTAKDIKKSLPKSIQSVVPVEDKTTETNTETTSSNTTSVKEKQIQQEAIAQENVTKARKADCFKKIASTVLVKMSEQVVNWALTGFKGDPFYVRDNESFIKSIDDQLVDGKINDITQCINGNCPYGKGIAKNIILAYKNETTPSNVSKFTLDKILGSTDAQEFPNDFSKGGWAGWEAYTQNPNNNAIGSLIETSIELTKERNKKAEEIKQELVQNNGFLSLKKCVEYKPNVDTNTGTYTQSYKGTKYFCKNKPDPKMFASCTPSASNICYSSTAIQYWLSQNCSTSSQGQNGLADLGYVAGGQKINNCAREEVTTPGAIIKEQLTKAINAPFENKQNEVSTGTDNISQLADLASNLIGQGLNKLITNLSSSGTNFSAGGLGFNSTLETGTAGNTWASSSATQGYIPELESPTILGTPGKDLKNGLDNISQEIAVLQEQVSLLNTFAEKTKLLDMCIPGPDTNWEERFNELYDNSTSQIRTIAESPAVVNIINPTAGTIAKTNATLAISRLDDFKDQYIDDTNSMIKQSLPSAETFLNQINILPQYNNKLKDIKDNIYEKQGILQKLNLIKNQISINPGSYVNGINSSGGTTAIAGNMLAIYNGVYQYVLDDGGVQSEKQKLANYKVENSLYFDQTSPLSLISQCISERQTLSDESIGRDQGKTYLCEWQQATPSGTTSSAMFGDRIVPKLVGSAYLQDFHPYTPTYTNTQPGTNIPSPPVEISCNDYYETPLSVYQK